eukprot:jgi/Botrbrau1/9178/Bobra.0236s0010.1
MELLLKIVLVCSLCVLKISAIAYLDAAKEDPLGAFRSWARDHGRTYAEGSEEFQRRFSVWTAKLHMIEEHNSQAKGYQLGLNGFADWTVEEFEAAYFGNNTGRPRPSAVRDVLPEQPYRYEHVKVTEPNLDWRAHGIVGPVKDQHVWPNGSWSPCGACWAYAATSLVESINAKFTGKFVQLSEQQLIDCDRGPPFDDNGCHAGWVDGGWSYLLKNGGQTSLSRYPNTGWEEECNEKAESKPVVSIDDYVKIPTYNDTAIMQALVHHPVSVYVCCKPNLPIWHAYSGGVFDIDCCTGRDNIDHAVTLVGYGETGYYEGPVWNPGEKYWLIKNSWGAFWGEEGYLRLKRGEGAKCNIGTEPMFPVKTRDNPVRDVEDLAMQ